MINPRSNANRKPIKYLPIGFRLTEFAKSKGWEDDGKEGHFPSFKKGTYRIFICDTCSGGFVEITQPSRNRFYKMAAKEFLENA